MPRRGRRCCWCSLLMVALSGRPAKQATLVQRLGVTLFVLGMLVSAFALRAWSHRALP
jgi:hypothetical protein